MKKVIFELLPVRDPQSLVRVSRKDINRPDADSFSYPFFRDLQEAQGLPFEGFLAYTGMGRSTLLTDQGAEPVVGEFVSGNYFQLLGVRAALGRVFTPDDDRIPGAHPVIVLSYNFWQRRFGADPSVLNQVVRLNTYPFTIVGVSAAGFDGLNPGRSPDYRVPFNMEEQLGQMPGHSANTKRGTWWLGIFGRLKPGIPISEAGNALQPLLLRNYELAGNVAPTSEYRRQLRASERMFVAPAAQGTAGRRTQYERSLWVLMAMVGAVLLLACVNIAHLVLARASAREHEFSIRLSLGAGRLRLVRQLLTESIVLAIAGGAAGLLVALGFSRLLLNLLISDEAHSTFDLGLDGLVLSFNFAVSLLAGIGFGLVPALRAAGGPQMSTLRVARTGSAHRLLGRKLLLSVQIGISLVLLAGAGLFVRTLSTLRAVDAGFPVSGLIQISIDPVGYAPERVVVFYRELVTRLNALPSISGAVVARQRIVSNSGWSSGIVVEGFTTKDGDNGPNRDAVGPGYFATLGLPLLMGREFTLSDTGAAPKVAIVNESFAGFYFGNENPLGKRIDESPEKQPEYTIVGVVKDAKYRNLRETGTRFWYIPYEQLRDVKGFRSATLLVRTTGSATRAINAIQATLNSMDRNIAPFQAKTLETQINENLTLERMLATLSTFFGLVAAILAGTGLFGVLSYSVSQRSREIGIRMALGARPMQAAWTIIGEVGVFAGIGIAAGLAGALASSRLLKAFLFGIGPNDAAALFFACASIAIVVAAAVFFPARRAVGIEPAVTLRNE